MSVLGQLLTPKDLIELVCLVPLADLKLHESRMAILACAWQTVLDEKRLCGVG
jgi:hypothetical protein